MPAKTLRVKKVTNLQYICESCGHIFNADFDDEWPEYQSPIECPFVFDSGEGCRSRRVEIVVE